jgi:hypothetical protein
MSTTFQPVSENFPGFPMPASVPPGLRLELSRAPLLDRDEAAFEDWMRLLHDRYDECLAAIPDERAVFEATFTHTESDGSVWMYHLSLMGEDSPGLDVSNPIGRDHLEQAMRTKHKGWEELRPHFMITPSHLAEQFEQWGRTGRP